MIKGAIIQSGYIPWKGYFDIIRECDVFVFLDDTQFTVRDWRNRNQIKTPHGKIWLTIPVGDNRNRLIQDVAITQYHWQQEHLKSIQQHYGKAPFFKQMEPLLDQLYQEQQWKNLSDFNQRFIKKISREFLGFSTLFLNAADFNIVANKTDRLIEICRRSGMTHYLSGPSARDYIEPERFKEAGITLEFKNYNGYPEYKQFYPPFDHYVSILDLLMHTGPEASHYIWGWRDQSTTE